MGKKYTEKNKKEYSKVKSFVNGFKSYEKKLKGIMNKTRQDCEKPNQLVEKYDIKVLDSDSLYNQFSNHKEELQNTVVKVKKSNSKFCSFFIL